MSTFIVNRQMLQPITITRRVNIRKKLTVQA